MSERFIKFIPSEEAMYLAKKHPNAFILLMFIAERARREKGHPDGLNVGECHIGDWENMGLTRQNYRTALKVLVLNKILIILETNRTRKKSTTGLTTEGTKVKLLNSDIWDININHANHRPNHCLTTDQPLPNHEQEGIRKKKKEKEEQDKARSAKRPRSKDFLSFDFLKFEFIGISEKDLVEWKTIYPHIDLKIEILKAAQWLQSNPTKSHKKNWRKYLTGWFGRNNDRIENKIAYRFAAGSPPQDRRTKNKDGSPIHSRAEELF